jgi:hypothetical protein
LRKALLVITGILLFGAGGAIGWFAATRYAPTLDQGARPGEPDFYYRAGDQTLLAPAPPWEEWKYPGSRVHNSAVGGGYKIGGIDVSNGDRVALVTPDDFDKVWAFYKERCQLRGGISAGNLIRFETEHGTQGITVKIFDEVQADSLEGPETESVRARAFSVRSLRYSLSGFVYRPKGGDSTCILLVYRPNTEFIGLFKEKLVKE